MCVCVEEDGLYQFGDGEDPVLGFLRGVFKGDGHVGWCGLGDELC